MDLCIIGTVPLILNHNTVPEFPFIGAWPPKYHVIISTPPSPLLVALCGLIDWVFVD